MFSLVEKKIKTVFIGNIKDFDEIPSNPKVSDFWMITPDISLWFSTYDNRWRFMLMTMGGHARRSGECFNTKEEAKEFYESGKVPTWVKTSLLEEKKK